MDRRLDLDLDTVQVVPVVPPSTKAQVGFWVGILNSLGLMGLGAYCLKEAVERTGAAVTHAGIFPAWLAVALGAVGFVALLWQRR